MVLYKYIEQIAINMWRKPNNTVPLFSRHIITCSHVYMFSYRAFEIQYMLFKPPVIHNSQVSSVHYFHLGAVLLNELTKTWNYNSPMLGVASNSMVDKDREGRGHCVKVMCKLWIWSTTLYVMLFLIHWWLPIYSAF